MAKAVGVGRVFLKARDPKALRLGRSIHPREVPLCRHLQ
jgi:hypothetical protein